MKLFIYTDPHFCTYSSVLRGRGKKYSFRLENLIDTFRWINDTASAKGCQRILCLGDLFDRPDLTAEEITALKEVDISKHEFLIGNHEALSNDLFFNSVNVLRADTYDKPVMQTVGNTQLIFLPYITENCREPITTVLDKLEVDNDKKIIILSHNDIKNIYYGNFLTTIGYDKEDIESNCDLFINGHIHNGSWIGKKILNLGSITGINFNNNAASWKPKAIVLDTETLEIETVDNPYGVLFYKEEFKDVNKAIDFINSLDDTKPIVVSVKCYQSDCDAVDTELSKHNFIYKRVLIDYTRVNSTKSLDDACEVSLNIDYFEKFREFIKIKYAEEEIDCKLMLDEINNIAARG